MAPRTHLLPAGFLLNAPKSTLRVVINVTHKDSSKPLGLSQINRFAQDAEEGP